MRLEEYNQKYEHLRAQELEMRRKYFKFLEEQQMMMEAARIGEASATAVSAAGGGQILREPPPSDPYDRLLWQANINGVGVPSSPQQAIHRQLIADLETAGIWSQLDVLYVYAQDGSEGFSFLNWKDATANSITKLNAPVWTSNAGWYIGTGVLRHNYLMSQGQNFQLDSAGFFFYTGNVVGPNTRWLGSGPGGSPPFRLRIGGASYYNTGATISDAPAPLSNNLYAGYRLDATNLKFYNGLTSYDRTLSPTTGRMTFPIELGLGFFLDASVRILGFGANLNPSHSTLNTILSNYISGL